MYGLQSQMRRAAISIASNIAEGFNRYHNKEYRQFLFVALGSCAELETQLEIAHDVGLISVEDLNSEIQQITSETKMIRSLIKKL
jgi:four helix bundle protein